MRLAEFCLLLNVSDYVKIFWKELEMPEILRFEMNVPTQISLKHPDSAKRVAGRYGDQVLYTLTDDRVIYVPPIVAGRITQLGIQPREVFQICKRYTRQGCRRLIDWTVDRLAEHDGVMTSQATSVVDSPVETDLSSSSTGPSHCAFDSVPSPLSRDAITRQSDMTDVFGDQSVGSSKETAPQEHVGGVEPATPANLTSPVAETSNNGAPPEKVYSASGTVEPPTKLEHALKTAISAAYNAEKFGAELGYVVRFDADAI
ncbi:MAG: hypothetical protein ABL962_17975, partial [Fimbriimonadaceae bacterium]